MRRVAVSLLAAVVLGAALTAVPARAQSIRTFVSGHGSDANPCTLGSPCRTFAQAFAVTAPGGEINALDPAGYGPVLITHAISIEGHGVASVTPGSGGIGFNIGAGTGDAISLRGLIIDGQGSANHAVNLMTGSSLTVDRCVIRNIAQSGIDFTPSAAANLLVSNTLLDHAGDGILVVPTGSGTVTVAVSNVVMNNGAGDGILVNGLSSTGPINATVSESVATGNAQGGVVIAAAASTTSVALSHSVVANNTTGLEAMGQGATLRVAQTVVTGNTNGWVVPNNGNVLSYGNNFIDGNSFNQSAPPGTNVK
jgi:hypothetical protein